MDFRVDSTDIYMNIYLASTGELVGSAIRYDVAPDDRPHFRVLIDCKKDVFVEVFEMLRRYLDDE